MEVVNLNEKLSKVTEHWSPKIVGEVNDSYVKVVKFKGAFVWHHHDNEDENVSCRERPHENALPRSRRIRLAR